MTNIVTLTNLHKRYTVASNEVTVLDDLNLEVRSGEKLAVIGPSGSGKTTLLLVLTGLEAPSSGLISIAGESLDSMSRDERADVRRENIGIVFQSFHLIPSLTARENVALPIEIAGLSDSRAQAMQMLESVGLADRADHYPTQLSGGEQQRVALARALINKPTLIVADEPTGNLDNKTGERIMQLLFGLNENRGTTLILVTHDNELAARCERTLRLQDGQLLEQKVKSSRQGPQDAASLYRELKNNGI